MKTNLITNKKPEKKLIFRVKKSGGRNSSGRVTIRFRGGGTRKLVRLVDFGEEKLGKKGKIIAIEYDPHRTAFLGLIEYEDKSRRYILLPEGVKINDEIICDEKAELKFGNRMRLKYIPNGTQVYNIELEPLMGGKMIKSAGNFAVVTAQDDSYCLLKLPSGEIRKVPADCFASIGQVSHASHRFEKLKKAGSVRLKGRKPHVRGSAMNPCDHPHGGGQGKTPIGMPFPKTPWGKIAHGGRTRKPKWTDKLIIKR